MIPCRSPFLLLARHPPSLILSEQCRAITPWAAPRPRSTVRAASNEYGLHGAPVDSVIKSRRRYGARNTVQNPAVAGNARFASAHGRGPTPSFRATPIIRRSIRRWAKAAEGVLDEHRWRGPRGRRSEGALSIGGRLNNADKPTLCWCGRPRMLSWGLLERRRGVLVCRRGGGS